MQYTHKNKEIFDGLRRIDIAEYKKAFLFELSQKEKREVNVNSPFEVERIKGLINIPENTAFKTLSDIRSGLPYWEEQKVDYIASNLGRGYIFYFLCNHCGRRVKYLYEYDMTLSPLCRVCCRITYRRERRKRT